MTKVKAFRQERGLTQSEIGRRLRIHPAAISHVEAGRTSAYPRLRRGLARVLGVRVQDLFNERGQPLSVDPVG